MRIATIQDGTGNAIFPKYGGAAKDERENSPIVETYFRRPRNCPQGKYHDNDSRPLDFAPSRLCYRARSIRDLDGPVGLIRDVRAVEWHGHPPSLRKDPWWRHRPRGGSSSDNRSGRTRSYSSSLRNTIVYI